MDIWHDTSVIFGVKTKAFFFDAETVQKERELQRRVLPFLNQSSVKTMFTEEDRKNFYCGELVAQPDAVFEHGNGLICVE